jgi:hypothetical protein
VALRAESTSASVDPSTCTVEAPPESGRNVVGIRTVTVMGETLPWRSGIQRVEMISLTMRALVVTIGNPPPG